MSGFDAGKAHGELGKGIGLAIAGVIGLVAIAFVAAYALGFFSDTTVERRGETAQQERTIGDPNYRIAQYDQFFDRCQAIVAVEGQIADTQAALATDSDATQRFYDQQNLRAQQGSRRSLIAAYNADSAKAGTAAQFKSSRLPSTIDPNGNTTCVA